MRIAALLSLLLLSFTSIAQTTVNVYSFRQPFLIEPILKTFTEETGIETRVVFAKKGLIQRLKREGQLSPADVVLTSNFAKLMQLKQEGLTQAYGLNGIEENVPKQFRDSEQQWLALTKRVRNVYSSKERQGKLNINYEDLADDKFKGKICTRSGKHPYNLGLIASMIVHNGEAQTKQWLKDVKENLARKPQGNDRAQVKAIKEGLCDVSLGNSYYLGKMLQDENQIPWANAVELNFPNQDNRGSHINVSGVVIAKYAPNKAAAQQLLAFLTSDKAQSLYAKLNMEYPVNPSVEASTLVKSWGEFKEDSISLEKIAAEVPNALKLVDEVKFDL
ncbi:extracellular solute-binding protein [Bermanella marisrubri]|uniref:Iron(III) ABC transporter, periplasmic iron(III)-binding protein n=1 Tax=Bermanella marisrubri TaxID=207949 RepID=Q1N0U4_9GAMM|nr:extracellular solute-binding protein [Bermanella marisrubri]EAT11930.1 Iron(III) ABC transporter, periplasmic iron(III)-binding protein [Oceanobacter sp. RED65] [Bermanella marisrubri]QIZ82994.1 extracellular solute-binding protein [Bermanella marisrubri]